MFLSRDSFHETRFIKPVLVRHLMRWPACQNTADCTALVAPQPEVVGVLYFKTKMAGNIKRWLDEMMIIMILLYNVSLYFFLSLQVVFSASWHFLQASGSVAPIPPAGVYPWTLVGDLPASASPNQNTLPQNVPRQAQRAVHQLRVNRLTTTASYQALVGRCASPVCCTLWCGWWDSGMSTSFVP